MPFAETTTVPVEKSRAEIETMVHRYGASQFFSGYDKSAAVIGFRCQDRTVKFILHMPDPTDKRFTEKRDGRSTVPKKMTPDQSRQAYEQERRRLWRALALSIKAKLEAVESGIETFEQAFLAHVVLPNGETVFQAVTPEIAECYKTGNQPKLLLGSGL